MKKSRFGSNNPNWRGGVPKCQDCGGDLSKYTYPKKGVKRCIKCYVKTLKGRTYPSHRITQEQLIKKFCKYVEKTDGCWNWLSTKNKAGYGKLSAGRKRRAA